MRLAGIDIGTLTCRLLVADVTPAGTLTTILSDRKILRLGQGVDERKRLHPDAITRVVETLKEWKNRIDAIGVDGVIAVATSAVREATNREELIVRLKAEAGLNVEVIDGEEEARRALLGISSGLPAHVADLLALDIGGGSTEFILSRCGAKPSVTSMDMGVVRVSERFFHHDPATALEIQDAQRFITDLIDVAVAKLGNVKDTVFIGTAGTITTLSAMAQGLRTYDPKRVHNSVLKLNTIKNLERELFARSKMQRRGMVGLEPGREEVIVAGVLILRCIMEHLKLETCTVSEYGLREGILIDLAERQREVQRI